MSGSYNIALGYRSGWNYGSVGTPENRNIVIGNLGVLGESNVMRLGTQGTGAGQISNTYIAGTVNTLSGRVAKTTSPGAYPYTALSTDHVIFVDTSIARTINLMASPETGRTYRIKDSTGNAAAANITITPAAGNIDGAASYKIATNYGSVDLVYNGTQWNCL